MSPTLHPHFTEEETERLILAQEGAECDPSPVSLPQEPVLLTALSDTLTCGRKVLEISTREE